MVNAASAAGFVDLCAGLVALEIFCFLDPKPGAGTAPSARAPLPNDSALGLLMIPLGAAAVLLAAVASIYRRLSHGAAPAADRSLSRVVNFFLCVSAGVLHFSLSAQPGGGASADHVAQEARALGLGALRALPAAATATFFWGAILIIVAHVRAGGEGGGGAGAGAGAGHGAVVGPVRLLTNVALGAAAGLVLLITMALGVKY